ncbi:MAG TPA: DUF1295 domain-containing protein [Xanthobacteraceae bacterium]|nr:DUF1295 domain-containing protein [Xanthobacteraceae bacterium]
MSLIQLTITGLFVAAASSGIMALAWVAQQRSGNSGWGDVTWSLGVGTTAAVSALVPLQDGVSRWRQIAIAAIVACWCLRLGLHIAGRARVAADDPRYRDLVTQWGADAARRMFWFLQAQAIVGALLSTSVAIAAHNPEPTLRAQDLVGLTILAAAIFGEAIADRQLAVFRADPGNSNAVCRAGLWSWSRHPNYFFEWLFWLAIPIVAIDFSSGDAGGWLTLSAPLCMYWVLVHVSGIPPLELHMSRTRGDSFREYQRETARFLPVPPSCRARTRKWFKWVAGAC